LQDVIDKTPENIHAAPHFSKIAKESGVGGTQKFTGRQDIGSQYHYTMEPQTCVVVPIEDGLDVYSSTQWMDLTQIAIADTLGVPNNTINMHVRRLGGGYGAKISRAGQIACAAAVAVHHLNRPVRMILSLEANMNIVGKRYACINDYQVEVDDNGKVQKLMNDYVEDSGCSPNEPGELSKIFSLFLLDNQIASQFTSIQLSSSTTATTPSTSLSMQRQQQLMHRPTLGAELPEPLKESR
jgi:xanthine dehydrogenase/oxidase